MINKKTNQYAYRVKTIKDKSREEGAIPSHAALDLQRNAKCGLIDFIANVFF